MKGLKTRHGHRLKRDWSKRIKKPYPFKLKIRFCFLCGKEIKLPSRKYCGHKSNKTGCAWKAFLLSCKKSQRKLYPKYYKQRKEYFKRYRQEHSDYFVKKRKEWAIRNLTTK